MRLDVRWSAAILIASIAVPGAAFAQTDEIQVYTGSLTRPGVVNLTLHTNFTPNGLKTPAFPGAVVADRSLNGVPEWALGLTKWFEAGLYLPLYSRDAKTGWGLDGVKLRALVAVPNADDRRFFYATNFELSYNAKQWDVSRVTSEIRPIIGWHLKPVDVIFNPILDSAYDGLKNLDFAPAMRVAYNFSSTWAMAGEEYADIGPLRRFKSRRAQAHHLYGVVDYTGTWLNVEAGIGFGLTPASDRLTFKLMFSSDLNRKPPSRP